MAGATTSLKKYDWPQAWLMFVAGSTMEEVAEFTGIPHIQVVDYSGRHRWGELRHEAQKRANLTVKRELARRIEVHRVKHQHFILDTLDKTQAVIEKIEVKPPEYGDNKEKVMEAIVDTRVVLSLTREHDDLARRTLQLDEQKNNDPVAMGFQVLIAMQDPQNTCLATSIPPEPSEHSRGIIRPFNGHNNGMPLTPITDMNGVEWGNGAEPPQNGAPSKVLPVEPLPQGVKPAPLVLKFKYPAKVPAEQPLQLNPVNENESREEA